jgi:BirA family transcriptional regulator, biotin operon repressor / biotin---[acetyl-CoA-carboxylase] ligase
LAEATFDRGAFTAALTTRALGRTLVVRAEAGSTNDLAWEGLAQGLPLGSAFVADVQTRGRGREGRSWLAPAGRGLLLSLVVPLGCTADAAGLMPLIAGLALAEALDRCGAPVQLKWPNDVLCEGRKLAGILCEARAAADDERVIVVGAGVNVTQTAADFPESLRARATSLAIEGVSTPRERVAAEFLNGLAPLLDEFEERGGAERARERYRHRAGFWGQVVSVRSAGRVLQGVARDLDRGGGLILRLDDGRDMVAVAGDVDPPEAEGRDDG